MSIHIQLVEITQLPLITTEEILLISEDFEENNAIITFH